MRMQTFFSALAKHAETLKESIDKADKHFKVDGFSQKAYNDALKVLNLILFSVLWPNLAFRRMSLSFQRRRSTKTTRCGASSRSMYSLTQRTHSLRKPEQMSRYGRYLNIIFRFSFFRSF